MSKANVGLSDAQSAPKQAKIAPKEGRANKSAPKTRDLAPEEGEKGNSAAKRPNMAPKRMGGHKKRPPVEAGGHFLKEDYSTLLPTFSRVTLKMRVAPGSMPP